MAMFTTDKVIQFDESQISFIFNNLECRDCFKKDYHDESWWYKFCELGDTAHLYPERSIRLTYEEWCRFKEVLLEDAEIILHQLLMDVKYHSYNDASAANSSWCLNKISDCIHVIDSAKFAQD